MNRYLLDTNIFVFFSQERDRLSRDVAAILQDYDTALYMSVASVQELIVLLRLGKLKLRSWSTPEAFVRSLAFDYRITVVPVDFEVMKTYAALEVNRDEDHNDPFDHVIISHALTMRVPVISSDRKFLYYRGQGLDLVYNGNE